MKKLLIVIAMVLLSLAPALLAQGTPITPLGADKLKISGELKFIDFKTNVRLILNVALSYLGRPVTGAIVRLDTTMAANRGSGNYVGGIDPYIGRLGNMIEISVEFPGALSTMTPKPPFSGRKVIATYRVDNLIEWIFPTYTAGQMIDLAAYPAGIPFRWNFLSAPIPLRLCIWDVVAGRMILGRSIDSEELLIPPTALLPGIAYETAILGQTGVFKLSKLASSDSEIRFNYGAYPAKFTTKAAK